MKALGLITEYNPFHNGHIYHLKKSQELTDSKYTVCIMSGNFVQKGEIAIQDKFTRSKIAIEHGIDLVIELPTIFATASADYFAFGAINILNSLNCIDSICFGSEDTDISNLTNLAKLLVDNKQDIVNDTLLFQKTGISYPQAREKAIKKYIDIPDDIFKPNNILATHYIKNLYELDSAIKPVLINRIDNLYNDTTLNKNSNISSATSIRKEIYLSSDICKIKDFVPLSTYNNLNSNNIVTNDNLFNILRYKIITDRDNLVNISEVVEGLENKIYNAAVISKSYSSLVDNIKSKRYTETKIKRILIHILLNITKDMLNEAFFNKLAYVRVLAMNEKGKEIISQISNNSNIPVITKINESVLSTLYSTTRKYLELDILATNLHDICKNEILNKDFTNRL